MFDSHEQENSEIEYSQLQEEYLQLQTAVSTTYSQKVSKRKYTRKNKITIKTD